MKTKPAPKPILAAVLQPTGLCLDITLWIPESELRDFNAYLERLKTMPFTSVMKTNPFAGALSIGTPARDDWGWNIPFNKGSKGVPSDKVRIQKIRRLLKMEFCRPVTFWLPEHLWERIMDRANHHGISEGEHCLSCIGYYAAVERYDQAKEKQPSPFVKFERALAKESKREIASASIGNLRPRSTP